MARYDTILHGGRVLDPANGLDAILDVAMAGGRVAALEPEVGPSQGEGWLDVSGKWVMPGVIDSHVHVAVGGRSGDRSRRGTGGERQRRRRHGQQ